jgi:hypothetical protein
MALRVLDFPAPFRPSSETTSPAPAVRLTAVKDSRGTVGRVHLGQLEHYRLSLSA